MPSLIHKTIRKSWVWGVCLAGVFQLTACSQFPKEEATTPESTPVEQSTEETAQTPEAEAEVPPVKVPSAEMEPETMYKIMVGEMLVQKGQRASAFGVLYPVAKKTRDPGLAERVFQLSMATYDLNAIQEAAKLWRDVSPDKAMAWKASYLISVREGKVGEALEFWQRYRALSDVSLEQDLIATAIRVTQAAQPTYGLEFLSGLKDLYPDEPAAVFGLGSAAEGYRVYDVAISNLEDASQRYKKRWKQNEDDFTAEKLYRESNHLLANAYLKSNQALLGLKRLSPYINENTDDWLMQERFARLEVKAGYFDEAEKRYLRIVENEPKAYTSKLSVALLRLERDDYAGADSLLKDLQGIPQYRSTANYYLGLSAQEQGHLEDAISYYKRINTSDYLVDAKLHIAEIEFSKIGLERTIENLEAIQSEQPEDQVKILRGKAIFYNIAGEKQKAIDEYQQAIDIDDQRADLYLMQSMLYYDLKQFDAYEENLEKALAINPNDVDALNALGYFFVEQGRDLDRAQQLLDKALALAPNRFYVLDSRGWLAYQQGDYEAAEAYLKQALSIQMDGEVLLHLIQTEWKLGKKDVAAELWNAHHEKFPENEALQQILQKLSSE